jgi:hypothetical protein
VSVAVVNVPVIMTMMVIVTMRGSDLYNDLRIGGL